MNENQKQNVMGLFKSIRDDIYQIAVDTKEEKVLKRLIIFERKLILLEEAIFMRESLINYTMKKI